VGDTTGVQEMLIKVQKFNQSLDRVHYV